MRRKKDDPPQYVLKSEFSEVTGKINNALFGFDGRGGIVKDIGDIKNTLSTLLDRKDETKTKGRDWRLLGFAILGSTITGLIIVGINYILTHLP